jgi:hypothetical protein
LQIRRETTAFPPASGLPGIQGQALHSYWRLHWIGQDSLQRSIPTQWKTGDCTPPTWCCGTGMADRRGSSSAKAEHLVGRQSCVGTSFTLLHYNNLHNSIDFQIHQNRLSATAPPHRAYRSVFCIWGHTISVCNLFNVRLF